MWLASALKVATARFVRDDRGNVFVLFAFALIALLAAIGLAVDGSRGFTVRSELRSALDAAGLAVAREYSNQLNLLSGTRPVRSDYGSDADYEAALDTYFAPLEAWTAEYVNEYLAANFDEGFFSSSTVTSDTTVVDIFADEDDTGQLDITARTVMPTYLLGLVQVDEIEVEVSGSYTIGGVGGTVEVALVLDNSGSVAWADVRGPLVAAVHSMMDELIPCADGETNCSNDNVFVSLVPFRAHIRLPNASYVDSWNVVMNSGGSARGACIDPRYSPITDTNNNQIHDPYETVDLCGDGTDRGLMETCVVGREQGFFDYYLTNSGLDHTGFGNLYAAVMSRTSTSAPGYASRALLPYLMQDLPSAQGGLDRAVWPAASLDYYYLSHLDDAPPSDGSSTLAPPRFRQYNGYLRASGSANYTSAEWIYQLERYRSAGDTNRYGHDGNSCSANEIVGPTHFRDEVEGEVDEWVAAGGTSMDTGMAWGWRTVSPRWQGYWGIGSDLPREYDDAGNTKAVVLVTDSVAAQVGRNVAMSCPIDRADFSGRTGINCSNQYPYNDENTVSDSERMSRYTQYHRHEVNMLLVCEQMREVGIEVTVVYLLADPSGSDFAELSGLQEEAAPIYEACATQPGDPGYRDGQQYYFEVNNEAELTDVFASIGQSLSALRIAQ
ncbi:MAG: hypothetical protein KDA64_03180 [Rhodospirillaceae bacterium]|nr:hypothetical protein [Rhodospirillaceae bacterium]